MGDQGFRVLTTWSNVRTGSIAVKGRNPDEDTPEDLAALDDRAGPPMKRDLLQLVVFAAWFVILARHAPLRALVRAAPRLHTLFMGAVLAAWTVVQVTGQQTRYFPLISVRMYGDYTPAAELRVARVVGEWCDGHTAFLNPSDVFPRALRGRILALQRRLANARTADDSATRARLLDSALTTLGRTHNRAVPDRPLCAIGLEVTTVPATQYESGIIPPPVRIRRVVLP
jgi:hypothetical protein